MTHNKNEISSTELFELIDSISKFVEKKINFYALGGTALTLLDIKQSTRDIDINIESRREYDYVCRIFENIGFEKRGIRWISQEGLAFDIFFGSNILGTELLPDCVDKSKFIKSFGNINLYTLSLEDIIISKLARGDVRDFEDIKLIFETQKMDLKKLINRYKETMKISLVANYKQKLIDLEYKFKEWGFEISEDLMKEVKKWE